MNNSSALKIIAAIIAVTTISACSDIDTILSDRKAIATYFFNEANEFTVINVKTGKIVKTCKQRAGGANPCKRPEGFPGAYDTKGHDIAEGKKSEGRFGILSAHGISVTSFKGSFCQSIENKSTGAIYEVCWPPA